eukprot:CAMPEP_0197905536 /NCGR_PEP_ID=MMETSP1439-20131203/60584_1 /TAXON_ID=66791 /ORGANISM="Gonyaulax spinifera, Strain CCMP409" /LENGTH=328 /DNA_ID=CAMNT_0043526819 /DNA_START=219 /DNA_END=1202 /DNA_ORIENTATION=+
MAPARPCGCSTAQGLRVQVTSALVCQAHTCPADHLADSPRIALRMCLQYSSNSSGETSSFQLIIFTKATSRELSSFTLKPQTLAVVCVAVVNVVHELRCKHDCGSQEPVDIEAANLEVWVGLHNAIYVDQRNYEAGTAALAVGAKPAQVRLHAQARPAHGVEAGDLLRRRRQGCEGLVDGSKSCHEFWAAPVGAKYCSHAGGAHGRSGACAKTCGSFDTWPRGSTVLPMAGSTVCARDGWNPCMEGAMQLASGVLPSLSELAPRRQPSSPAVLLKSRAARHFAPSERGPRRAFNQRRLWAPSLRTPGRMPQGIAAPNLTYCGRVRIFE